MATWSDLKAAYNLFHCDDVTFEAVGRSHWELTRQRPAGRYLIIGDTTELDFGYHREVEGLGPTGNGGGKGFLLHNALMVDAKSREIIGIAGQTIHYRSKKKSKSKRENVPAVAGLFLPRETGRGAARVQLDCGLTVLVSPA
jgi:hypothetical protein